MSKPEKKNDTDYDRLFSLVVTHLQRFQETNDVSEMDQAVEHLKEAIRQTPEGSQELAGLHDALGEVLAGGFRLLGDPANLEQAIGCWTKAKELAPGQYLDPLQRLVGLDDAMYNLYKQQGRVADLEKAIECGRLAVVLTAEDKSELPGQLDRLGVSLLTRFQQFGDLADLEKAIAYKQQAVSLTPEGHSDRPRRLSNIGASLYDRFQRLGNLADLERSIEYKQEAMSLTPEGHPDQPRRLDSLGVSLHARFQRMGDPVDLDKSIQFSTKAMSLTPEGHTDRPRMIDSLGVSLHTRFQRRSDLTDLEMSIKYKQQAVLFTPEGDLDRPRRLDSLGESLHVRFQHLGDLKDIGNSIEYKQQAASLTPEGHAERPKRFGSLGASLYTRFQHLGDLADLDNSIKYKQQAILLTPEEHSDRPGRLDSLGASLHARFQRLGDLADLEQSIKYKQQAMSLTPEDHAERPKMLYSLGVSLHARFQRLGNLVDLDNSIKCEQQAVLLTPEGHSNRPGRLDSLGVSLHTRFLRLGDLTDLDKDIECSTQAISLTLVGHPDRPSRLRSLGVSLHTRFEQLGDLADLDKSIEYFTEMASLTLEDDSNRPSQLDCIGVSLHTRFEHLDVLADLNKSIKYKKQAMSLTPEGHSDLPKRLDSLGVSLHTRFKRLGDLADLEEAIAYKQQAVSLTPADHSNRPRRLNGLGVSLHTRIQHRALPRVALENQVDIFPPRSCLDDLSDPIHCFRSAAESATGPPKDRFDAGLHWARLSPSDDSSNIVSAYGQVMKILPQLVWLGTPAESRYKLILDATGSVSTEAASAAICLREYSLALEWLEEGRSIVWKQMLQLRTPIDELFVIESSLAQELQQVARDLDYASSPKPMDRTVSSDDTSMELAAQRHHQLAARWKDLVDQVRSVPGFETFLCPQKASELMCSARSGPVVVINIHESRCDALVIQPGVTEISHVPLRFSSKQAKACRVHMLHYVRGRGLDVRGIRVRRPEPKGDFRRALSGLWKDLVKPILYSLGYVQLPSTSDLPHITWCTTGPLSFLPLHAAGDYDSQDMIFNYVVSSYTPTLSALLFPDISHDAFSGILAVGQESTPGMNPLPGTVAELNQIQKTSNGYTVTRLDRHLATSTAVMAGMGKHSWVHLACHASQSPTSPLQSAFHLHDGNLDLATITHKQIENADLAFLSACQTATGDESLSEEAVHLAAGMLMAGYKSVIATMWSIGDEDAPLIAEKVYEHLLEGGVPDSRRAAVAVHKATACLREKVGVDAFEKWVPYIHIGQ